LQENGSKGIHRLPLTPNFCNKTEHSSMDKVENILLRRFRGAMVPAGNAPNIGGTGYYFLSLILRKDTNFYTICKPFQRQFLYKFTNDQPAHHTTQKRPHEPTPTYGFHARARAYNNTSFTHPPIGASLYILRAHRSTPRGAKAAAGRKSETSAENYVNNSPPERGETKRSDALGG
jgi:hypothetical protein